MGGVEKKLQYFIEKSLKRFEVIKGCHRGLPQGKRFCLVSLKD